MCSIDTLEIYRTNQNHCLSVSFSAAGSCIAALFWTRPLHRQGSLAPGQETPVNLWAVLHFHSQFGSKSGTCKVEKKPLARLEGDTWPWLGLFGNGITLAHTCQEHLSEGTTPLYFICPSAPSRWNTCQSPVHPCALYHMLHGVRGVASEGLFKLACRPAGDVWEGNESGAPHYYNIYKVP